MGLNDAGKIVGESNHQAFLHDAGRFTIVNAPGAINTNAIGINNIGQVVGPYVDSAGTVHGYIYSAGQFASLSDPLALPGAGAYGTYANAINDRGQVVGIYGDGQLHGFIYDRRCRSAPS